MKRKIVIAMLSVLVVGCSKSAENITPAYVSPYTYKNYNCDQTRDEMVRVNTQVNRLSGRLDDSAETDAGVAAVGIVLFWPALFFIGGTNRQESRYARLRGEYIALEQSAIQKKCDFPQSRTWASSSSDSPNVSSNNTAQPDTSYQAGSKPGGTANVDSNSAKQPSDSEEQYRRAVDFEHGNSQPRDYKQAVEWYRKAAAQGHRDALYNLGMMYLDGRGVRKNNGEAVIYFRQAAELKHPMAHFNMGFMLDNGRGVARSPSRGLTSYIIASNLGVSEASNNRDNVAARLSPVQVSEAERRADDWMNAHRR